MHSRFLNTSQFNQLQSKSICVQTVTVSMPTDMFLQLLAPPQGLSNLKNVNLPMRTVEHQDKDEQQQEEQEQPLEEGEDKQEDQQMTWGQTLGEKVQQITDRVSCIIQTRHWSTVDFFYFFGC
jgi:hypothetical protein